MGCDLELKDGAAELSGKSKPANGENLKSKFGKEGHSLPCDAILGSFSHMESQQGYA